MSVETQKIKTENTIKTEKNVAKKVVAGNQCLERDWKYQHKSKNHFFYFPFVFKWLSSVAGIFHDYRWCAKNILSVQLLIRNFLLLFSSFSLFSFSNFSNHRINFFSAFFSVFTDANYNSCAALSEKQKKKMRSPDCISIIHIHRTVGILTK